jgi:3-oxoacyl-[acyl-carrier protein] reductase
MSMQPCNDFAGRTVAITGACGAYGRELADTFHRQGARLLLSDRDPAPAPGLPAGGALYVAADLAAPAGVDALADALLADGVPDVLVNNAGVFPFVDLLSQDLAGFDAVLGVNLRAPFRLMQRIGAAMARRGSGVICNISSGAASVVREDGAVYGASKAALEHLTRAFAVRLGPDGVRVNAVRPGLRGDTRDGIPAAHLQRVGAAVPLRRLARVGEVASVVAFLCSDAAAFVNGETLAVDGGNGINRRVPR